MTRLQTELQRLYLPRPTPGADAAEGLIDAQGQVRAMVLELAGPADWEVLSRVWRGVQVDLELPAPAIAVNGADALQLWFSLDEAVPVPQAHAFLEALRRRYLPDVAPKRVRLMPAEGDSLLQPPTHARLVPAEQGQTGNWSAFVAPDLAPVFAETPWLDIPPGEEGQAGLLSGLRGIPRGAFASVHAPAAGDDAQGVHRPAPEPAAALDPKGFLLKVMNDDSVALSLRIQAAEALLPYCHSQPGRSG